jgi:DNA-binding transcriptional MerR regulator
MKTNDDARAIDATGERPHYDAGRHDGGSAGSQLADAAAAERMSLAELTEAADVSVRTVRYYIAEGLLPPPEGSGPGSAYTPGHLNRLRLIQRLKAAYLPLREIRRRLAGLVDEEVQSILAAGDDASRPGPADAPLEPSLAPAREYLALLETRARYRTEPLALSMPPLATPRAEPVPMVETAPRQKEPMAREPLPEDAFLASVEERPDHDLPSGTALWRRIALGDEAELVVSDRVYKRHRDRIDWLVRWARKVFA